MGFYGRQLDRFLRRHIRRGQLELRFADGSTSRYGDGSGTPQLLHVHDDRWLGRVLRNPDLRLGEAYMAGAILPEGDGIFPALDLVWSNIYGTGVKARRSLSLANRFRHLMHRANPPARSRRNVAHHYDLGNDLYQLFLDADMQYSCAYYADPALSLNAAQAAKRDHISRKLAAQPGHRVLDIGCGWGGLALHLARSSGADVLGVTLSSEQLSTARQRALDARLDRQVRFEMADYRSLDARFDRIVSIGMLEHVGKHHYGDYFGRIANLLDEDGVALIHTIGRTSPPGGTNPWIARYIFPGGYIPALSELVPHIEAHGLYITDIEVLRLHYAETLKAWRERFLANADKAAALYDERFVRMWDFYLATSELSFRYGDHVVYQLQLARRQDAVPLTRAYLYPPAHKHHETVTLDGRDTPPTEPATADLHQRRRSNARR